MQNPNLQLEQAPQLRLHLIITMKFQNCLDNKITILLSTYKCIGSWQQLQLLRKFHKGKRRSSDLQKIRKQNKSLQNVHYSV